MTSERKSRKAQEAPARAHPAAHVRRGGGWRELFAMDSEHSSRFLLIGAVALTLIVAGGFIAYGYYDAKIKPEHRTVLAVDGEKVSFASMKRWMLYEYDRNPTFQQDINNTQALPPFTSGNALERLIYLARADDLGVTLSDEEFDSALRIRVGAVATDDKKTFAEKYRRALKESGLHEGEYEDLVRAQELERKVRDKFQAELPATAPQAKLEVIQVATQDAANQAIARVKAGEDWATVAKEVSKESDVQTTGGVHDYGPADSFNPAYDDYAFSAPVGEVSPALAAASGSAFFVVRVVDRVDRELADAQKGPLAAAKVTAWVEDNKTHGGGVINRFDETTQAEAFLDIRQEVIDRYIAIQKEQQRQQAQPTAAPVTAPTLSPDAAATAQAGQQATPAEGQVTPAATAGGGDGQ